MYPVSQVTAEDAAKNFAYYINNGETDEITHETEVSGNTITVTATDANGDTAEFEVSVRKI